MIRAPICTVVGHIDHGKTSILDFIRKSSVVKKEAGGITQAISSTNLKIDVIKKVCGKLLDNLKLKVTIPGVLFIDTPGHAAFNNLRKRGGALADIAVVVVDANEGVKDQTVESIEILKASKTPFILAANKIDLIAGWRSNKSFLLEDIGKQGENVITKLDNKLYEIVGKLSELGLNSERFDRVDDYTKQIAIVPCSAKTGEGLPELLMVLTGLAQRFLEKSLNIQVKGKAKGTVLEVKEEKGLGVILDAIVYDGSLKKGDEIIIAGIDKPVVTKVKALFVEGKRSVTNVSAAAGVRINAVGIKDVVAGMMFKGVENLIKDRKEIQKDVEKIFSVDKEGVIVKADSLGSLEALIGLLHKEGILIKKASIGDVGKKDIAEAKADEELNRVVLGFNVSGASKEVKVICRDVIYKIIDDYKNWKEKYLKDKEKKVLKDLIYPCKVHILPGCVFRQSNPAVVGVIVLGGKLYNDSPLMKKDGSKLSVVKSMQKEGENVSEALKNDEVAIALPGVTVGRQIQERDTLFSDISENDFIRLKELKKYLKKEDLSILKEIAQIKRVRNPVWGV